MASGFAVGAVAAAGVAAAAVTFGVAPALGLVVGLAVSKGLGEYHYQSSSNALRRAIKGDKSNDKRNTLPLDKLPEAVTKVVKKYIRVARRGKQLVGGARGAAYNLRHMTTTIRAAWTRNDHIDGPILTNKFGDDYELKRRLLEFRYYAQMTYNTVGVHLAAIVESRNKLVENSQLYYAHILRQVHFTGNHDNCGVTSCYNISASDFRTNVRTIGLSRPHGNILTTGYHARQDAAVIRKGALAIQAHQSIDPFKTASETVRLPPMDTAHLKTIIQSKPQSPPEKKTTGEEVQEMMKEEAGDKIGWGVVPEIMGDMATGASDHAAGGFENWAHALVHTETSTVSYTSFKSVHEGAASVPFGAAVGAGVGTAGDLAISFGRERYARYQVRKKVLGMQGSVELLLDASHQAAHDEMEKFAKLKKEDLQRISEKIIWYGKKIHELESDDIFKKTQQAIGADKTFVASKFPKCDDAYNLWYSVQYLMRQYGKLIANLVCMEIMLLRLDTKLVHMELGVAAGSLVKDGVETPARPAHMKDID